MSVTKVYLHKPAVRVPYRVAMVLSSTHTHTHIMHALLHMVRSRLTVSMLHYTCQHLYSAYALEPTRLHLFDWRIPANLIQQAVHESLLRGRSPVEALRCSVCPNRIILHGLGHPSLYFACSVSKDVVVRREKRWQLISCLLRPENTRHT